MAEYHVIPGDDVQAVLDRAEAGSVIRFAAGEYRQKLVIRTPDLTLIGAGAEETVLVYGDYARKLDEQGREYNTFRTWTLAVCADGVLLRGLSVVNDSLHPESKGQEVALSVNGDRFVMLDCILRSTQDTLFLGPLPDDLIERYRDFLPAELRRPGACTQFIQNCRIDGTVDFIFGCGDAVFDRCELRSVQDARDIGYVAAPAHALSQKEGFLFRRCAFTAEEGVSPGSIFLARPWRDYGLCRFEDCSCGPHISPAGFDPWRDSGRDRTARFFERPAREGRVAWANPQTEA